MLSLDLKHAEQTKGMGLRGHDNARALDRIRKGGLLRASWRITSLEMANSVVDVKSTIPAWASFAAACFQAAW